MILLLARLIARYVSGGLMSLGWLAPETAAQIGVDPDVIALIGFFLGAATEGLYALAKKKGWLT